jgi:hypothetical protein
VVKYRVLTGIVGLVLFASQSPAERINQEGRILGPIPVVTNSVLFNTPQADAIVSALQIFPVTNAWTEDISHRPVLPNSDAMIAQIMADLASSRRTLRVFQEMNFVLVPDSQSMVPIAFITYPGDSDPGPWPIPSNMPIETWPSGTGTLTLQQWQQDVNNSGGDRHSIIVQPGLGFTYETWEAQLTNGNWQAANGAKFDLKSNALRTAGYTSGDAAGLSMFPALPRYDECERGMVEHACRVVVGRSRQQYIYPATHSASSTPASQTNVPAMGQRVRLKSSFVISNSWATEEKAILKALKKYGAIVADNGNFFSISITPDDRWPANAFNHISSIGITNFEVIQTTGSTGGPRSPGAPAAYAGPDASAPPGVPVNLSGFVNYSTNTTVIQWKLYSGPGTVTFGNAAQTNTTATFSGGGTYTLMLSADDSVHSVAYDAVVFTVTPGIALTMSRIGTNLALNWSGSSTNYILEKSSTLPATSWQTVLTTNGQSARVPISGASGFFRVRGQ